MRQKIPQGKTLFIRDTMQEIGSYRSVGQTVNGRLDIKLSKAKGALVLLLMAIAALTVLTVHGLSSGWQPI